MTFHLIHADNGVLLSSSRAVIKRSERFAISDAIDALSAARDIKAQAQADAEGLRKSARAEGLAEAKASVRDLMAEELGVLTARIDEHLSARRNEIANAAYAAAKAIIGEFDDFELVRRVVDRTLARIDGDAPVTVEVAPTLCDAVSAHLAGQGNIRVVAEPGYRPTDCRIVSENGSIVASLSVQLDSLAARWGVAA